MKKITAIFALFAITVSACATDTSYYRQSLVNLIATPKPLLNSNVVVTGYLEETINVHIFLTIDHAMIDDTKSAVGVWNKVVGESDLGRMCASAYVELQGKFTYDKRMGLIIEPDEVYKLTDGKRTQCYPM